MSSGRMLVLSAVVRIDNYPHIWRNKSRFYYSLPALPAIVGLTFRFIIVNI